MGKQSTGEDYPQGTPKKEQANIPPIINTIRNVDCFEGMELLDDKSIDMILCDPPYGKTNLAWDLRLPINHLFNEYKRLLKDDGVIVLFSKQPFTSFIVFNNQDIFQYELIWEKTRAGNNMLVKKQPSQIHENILVFYKKQPTYNDLKFKVDDKYVDKRKSIRDSFYSNGHYSGVMRRKKDDGWRHSQSILPFNSVWRRRMHPTEKPVELFEYLIKTYSNVGDVILDNCIGSGTTAVACKRTGRGFIGFELNPEYCKMAEERLKKVPRRLDKFANME